MYCSRTEEFSNSYIHPYTLKKLLQMQNEVFCKNGIGMSEGKKDKLNDFDGSFLSLITFLPAFCFLFWVGLTNYILQVKGREISLAWWHLLTPAFAVVTKENIQSAMK